MSPCAPLYTSTSLDPDLPLTFFWDCSVAGLYKDFSIDLSSNSIHHFLTPNEHRASLVQTHFFNTDVGVHLCTGSERFFSNAFYCPYPRDGFIGIDIDPYIKAYNEFNTLLLILASRPEEFVQMASFPGNKDTEARRHRIACIEDRIRISNLPDDWKAYYKTHLTAFGDIYFPAKRDFFDLFANKPSIDLLRYHEDPESFWKLKRMAMAGQFVFLCKNFFDDLSLFNPIAECDTSNIYSYHPLQMPFSMPTHVIWTSHTGAFTTFHSYTHVTLDQSSVQRIRTCSDTLYAILKREIPNFPDTQATFNFSRFLPSLSEETLAPNNSYTNQTLCHMNYLMELLTNESPTISQEALTYLKTALIKGSKRLLLAIQKGPKFSQIPEALALVVRREASPFDTLGHDPSECIMM